MDGQLPPPAPPTIPPRVLQISRSALVLTLFTACFRLMQGIYPYAATILLGYLLLVLIAVEVFLEEWLKKVKYPLLVLDIMAIIWFSVAVTFQVAPLDFNLYAPPQDHPSGTVIGGILWHPNLADLRLAITNPSGDDYHGVDILIRPDQWIYKAAIIGDSSSCLLLSVGGNTVSSTRASKSGKNTTTVVPLGNGF